MKSWEAREMMVSNLVLKPLLTTQPLRSKTLLRPVNGATQSAGVYFFFLYSWKQTIKRSECKNLRLSVKPALTGGSFLLHLRETFTRCRRGAASREGTSLGPSRARRGRWQEKRDHYCVGAMGVSAQQIQRTKASTTEGGSYTEHVVGWSPALRRDTKILLPHSSSTYNVLGQGPRQATSPPPNDDGAAPDYANPNNL